MEALYVCWVRVKYDNVDVYVDVDVDDLQFDNIFILITLNHIGFAWNWRPLSMRECVMLSDTVNSYLPPKKSDH